MKKVFAMMLALAMLLGCTAAFAETETAELTKIMVAGAFEIKGVLPEGYAASELAQVDATQILQIFSEDNTKPLMVISLALDETYADVERMNDLSEEDLKEIEATFTEEDNVKIDYTETSHGTKLMQVSFVDEEGKLQLADFCTIYKGYSIEFVIVPGLDDEDQFLTQEQLDMAVKFLSDLEFVPVE